MYDTSLFSFKDDADFSASLQRVYEITSCTSYSELAELFNIRLSILSDAKRRKRMPPELLLMLFFNFFANPLWILEGKGLQFLQSCKKGGMVYSLHTL